MPLSQYEKDLIKNPNYFGHISQIKPAVRRMPQVGEYKLTTVPNTWIKCTHCYGNKVEHQQSYTGHIVTRPCGICGGKGEIFR